MSRGYARKGSETRRARRVEAACVVGDKLEELARQGAQAMLAAALEQEVDEFLQRARYVRGREFRGYRNGHAPERTVGVGVGAVPVRMPRVSDVPREVAPNGFESQIVGRYQRTSEATQRLLARLYLEGLSTGDPSASLRAGLRARLPGPAGGDGAAVAEQHHTAEGGVARGVRGVADAVPGQSSLSLPMGGWGLPGRWARRGENGVIGRGRLERAGRERARGHEAGLS